MLETHVVYKIVNIHNNREYIGVTNNFKRRLIQHKNKCPKNMIDDFNKYGWDCFSKKIICSGNMEWCYTKEVEYIEKLKPYYNISIGGEHVFGLKGEDCPTHKLSNKEAETIRILYSKENITHKELSIIYKVDSSTLSDITSGKSFTEVGGPRTHMKDRGLTEEEVIEARTMFSIGDITHHEIAKLYNINRSAISDMLNGKTYKEFDGPIALPKQKGIDSAKRMLTEQQVIEARIISKKSNLTYQQIVDMLNLTITDKSLGQIIRGSRYKNVGGPIKGVDY